MSYITKTYKDDGGDVINVADGGEIAVAEGGVVSIADGGEISITSGGTITAAGTQAANIVAAKADYTAGDLDAESEIIIALNLTNTKLNSVITALKGVGILASS